MAAWEIAEPEEQLEQSAPAQPDVEQQGQFRTRDWFIMAGVTLAALIGLWWATSTAGGRALTKQTEPPPIPQLATVYVPTAEEQETEKQLFARAAAQVARAKLEPAPTVRRGPNKVVKGKQMSTWVFTGAGDASYNGTYTESGTFHDLPSYTNGSRWLFVCANGAWALNTAKLDWSGDDFQRPPYYNDSTPLPGTWYVSAEGTSPAPSLSEYIDPDGPGNEIPDYPTTYGTAWWWQGGAGANPYQSPLQPCRALLGSPEVEYVVFPYCNSAGDAIGFTLYDVAAGTWSQAPLGSGTLLPGEDPHQSGGVFDAGDGTHVWVFSGRYDSSGLLFTCRKFSITVGTSSAQVSTADVTLTAGDQITNCVQVGDAAFRLLLTDASGDRHLCSYTGGDATLTPGTALPAVAPLPAGYTIIVPAVGAQSDERLYRDSNGTLYWSRHCKSATGQHRLAVYRVGDTYCQLEPDLLLPAVTDHYHTWGRYEPGECLACNVGSGGTGGTIQGLRWAPGSDAAAAFPFVEYPVGRHWYLDSPTAGGDLLIAGWSLEIANWALAAASTRPFVLTAAPAEIVLTTASTAAVAFPVTLLQVIEPQTARTAAVAYPVTVVEAVVIEPQTARTAAVAYPCELIPIAPVRDPGPSVAHWHWVRVMCKPA